MTTTKRVQDSKNSKEVEKFLDLYLYKDGAKRISDKITQLKGMEDIQVMEVILVEKSKIIEFIEEKCCKLTEIIKKGDSVQGAFNYKGFRFVKSKHKVESPVNILIKRNDLRRMSVMDKLVKP